MGRFTGVALLLLAAAHAKGAEPVAVLTQPGLEGRFCVLGDGSVRVGSDGPAIAEWLATGAPSARPGAGPDAELSWLRPGVRVVRSVRTGDDWELTTLSGAGGYGVAGEESLWLFRSIRVANRGKQKRQARLSVVVSRGGAALKDDVALLDGETVLSLVSRKPDEVQASEGETIVAFDLSLPPKGTADILLAAPAAAIPYHPRDLPDVRNVDPETRLDDAAEWWEGRLLPQRLELADERVMEAFHAAVGTLLIERPSANDTQAVASALSGLARAGHGPEMARAVEGLVGGQGEDGRFAEVDEAGLQADLTTALADCALYSEAPERWTHVLWRTIERSVSGLGTQGASGSEGERVALASDRAADVAGAVGETSRAEELRGRAKALLTAGEAPAPLASIFGVRARALGLLARGEKPPPVSDGAPLGELLAGAHLTTLAGDASAKRRAWEAVTARLGTQALPGVQMDGEAEDARVAAQLVFLVADSVVRAEGDALHVLPSFPLGWAREGKPTRLSDFPSGLGPFRLEATLAQEGTVTLSMPKSPKLARRLRVSAPLGMEVGGLRANGKPMAPETFEAGPPWELDASVWSLVMVRG